MTAENKKKHGWQEVFSMPPMLVGGLYGKDKNTVTGS
nr:MAG TPA: hypothetical protein [Caudoviricetes sp.]